MDTNQTPFNIEPFDTRLMEQLSRLINKEWPSSDPYELFTHNEWQPWFSAYQIKLGERLAAFALMMNHGKTAWFGCLVVNSKNRRQGMGKAMVQYLINEAQKKGVQNISLCASELGFPLYEQLGFRKTDTYCIFTTDRKERQRYETSKVFPAQNEDLKAILKIDREASGEERNALITSHLKSTFVYKNEGKIEGFIVTSLGTGLVVATTEEAGLNLLKMNLRRKKEITVIPQQNIVAIDYLRSQGFREIERTPRMILGEDLKWNPSMIFSRGSGYTG